VADSKHLLVCMLFRLESARAIDFDSRLKWKASNTDVDLMEQRRVKTADESCVHEGGVKEARTSTLMMAFRYMCLKISIKSFSALAESFLDFQQREAAFQ
jgi:hypothetical protein